MKHFLHGKNILYVAPRFFGYENEIRDELVRRGGHVDFLLDRPFDTPLLKAVTRIRREWIIGAADRYYEKKCSALADYDYVFVVSGQTLSPLTLSRWHDLYPRAKFILYMWDSFGNRPWAIDNLQYFDYKFTFDRQDAEKYKVHFRPLFFSCGFELETGTPLEWDISFIGTAHTDRFSVVSKISKSFTPEIRSFWYLFLQAKWVFWLYLFTNSSFRNAKLSDFKFQPLTKHTVQGFFNSSKAILDIEHPKQTGLTMRTLETIGAKKKLVTTNQNVKYYDFYDERNICVIDRKNPIVPDYFLKTPYIDVADSIYHRYRLEGWMDDILEAAR